MGRLFVTTDDIRAIAPPVLRHRLKLNFNADAAGVNADEVIRRLLAHVPAKDEQSRDPKVPEVFKASNVG
jgi:MoxR-like ATPase